ncbi:uncharacterized protein LOC130934182 [Arachis stenosperma]|uniref:uncharacterized protein LOC130934182 n=1 Tax=Arachis stenosperma TaxID=217475 RepID=UPI0025ACD6CA|nr:uncharacterized protein LOC130934182 [Arachis stenosperma]
MTTYSEDLRCQRCGGFNPDKPSRKGLDLCYKCGMPGHISRDFSHRRTQDADQFQQQGRADFRRNNNDDNNNHQGRRYEKQPQNELNCKRCGIYHLRTPCRAGLGLCYYCGGAGHMSWNCPEKANKVPRGPNNKISRML